VESANVLSVLSGSSPYLTTTILYWLIFVSRCEIGRVVQKCPPLYPFSTSFLMWLTFCLYTAIH